MTKTKWMRKLLSMADPEQKRDLCISALKVWGWVVILAVSVDQIIKAADSYGVYKTSILSGIAAVKGKCVDQYKDGISELTKEFNSD